MEKITNPDEEYNWQDFRGRLISDYSREELLEQEIQAMASFVEYMAHCRPELLLSWMRAHPTSDFVRWLRSFENTGC
jgi:hypothetical protein